VPPDLLAPLHPPVDHRDGGRPGALVRRLGGELDIGHAGLLAVYPTVADLLAELRRSAAETRAMVAALPDSFVARKGSYWRLPASSWSCPPQRGAPQPDQGGGGHRVTPARAQPRNSRTISRQRAATAPEMGMVSSHAQTTRRATPQRTADKRRVAPTRRWLR